MSAKPINDQLQQRLDSLPAEPGVYLMKNAQGQILYVGKALVLRHRVRSYFQSGKGHSPKIRALVSQIEDLETITTRNEVEALVLESNLIKHHRPYYNALLKDDKSYPFLKLSLNEEYPRLTVVRQRLADGARYFGPYPDGPAMHHTVHLIEKVFPLRRRRTPQFRNRPCLNYHMGRCLGPCQALVEKDVYMKMVEDVADFLEGKHDRILARLKREMAKASEALDFERAGSLRDQLQSLESFRQRQKVVGDPGDDQDGIGMAIDEKRAVFQVFQVRQGKVIGRLIFTLDAEGEEPADLLEQFLIQYYGRTDNLPREVLLPLKIEGEGAVSGWLSERRGTKVTVFTPARGSKVDLLRLVTKNAEQELGRLKLVDMAESRTAATGGPAELARALGLEKVPGRIEAFDISHLGGTDIVASMVVFINGRPAKAEYRRFKLKTVHDNDDFASMREVIARRYRRSQDGDWPWPDLVIIDGGKGQLSAALDGIAAAGVEPGPIFGLAKREEEIFLPGARDALMLDRSSAALHLVQQVRDEAHRFAVTFQRQQRGKRMTMSILDDVPGLGPVRRKKLIEQFGSVSKLRELEPDDLERQTGLPRPVAAALYQALHEAS
jgi:excinuclease ABC subunit C